MLRLIHYERASRDRAAPRNPPGKNRTTSSATAETMKVASSPSRPQELAGDDQEDRAERRAEDGAPAAEHGGDDDVDADGDVDDGADRRGAEVEHQQRACEPGEERADDEGRELVLGDVEAERAGLHRILAAGLQDEADRRLRQAVQDRRRSSP